MKGYFFLYKPVGITPLDCIQTYKAQISKPKNQKFAYAGRLDPMARGLLLILQGNETKNREKYQSLDKEYIFKVLLGVGTDTGDVLGKVRNEELGMRNENKIQSTKHQAPKIKNLAAPEAMPKPSKLQRTILNNKEKSIESIKNIEQQFSDKTFDQSYPSYSSKTVLGKPLYWWARNNRLDEIEIPTKNVTIHSLEFIHDMAYSKKDLGKLIRDRIEKVKGDFRQEVILKSWDDIFDMSDREEFVCLKFKAKVSSGTYIRVLAEMIGEELGEPALALDIFRSKILV